MAPTTYTLYYNTFSICSLMVRYTVALRGSPQDASSAIEISEQNVDIFHEEQLSEQFLCEVNPKGQVPVLTSASLDKPIADSLLITHYLASLFPSLIPTAHKERITKALEDLHALNFFSMTFAGRGHVAQGFKDGVAKRLEGDISDRYREALKYKLEVTEHEKIGGLKPGTPEAMNERARLLMKEFEALLPDAKTSGSWLLGLPQPSALDAHLIVFIARMRDVGRREILPEALERYADAVMARDEWKNMMQGRKTVMS